MVDDPADGVQGQLTLSNAGVAVLVAAPVVHAVVQMHGLQPVQAHHPVKLREHPIQVVFDVIASVPDVAGVQTDAQMLRVLHPVDDGAQVLEPAAHLAALARHGLQQHRGVHLRPQHPVQQAADQLNARWDALAHMAAGMEIVVVARHILQPGQVLGKSPEGKVPHIVLSAAGVQGIGGVSHHGPHLMGTAKCTERRHVRLVQGLHTAAPGIAGEQRKGTAPQRIRMGCRSGISPGGGHMTSDIKHGKTSRSM